MKKLVLFFSWLLLSSTLYAQTSTNPHAKIPLLEDNVNRAAVQQPLPKTAWKKQLILIQSQFKKIGSAQALSGLPAVCRDVLTAHQQQIYMQRLLQVQKSVNANKTLSQYTFVAPVPTDLAQFSQANYEILHAFLKELDIAKVTRLQRVHPFTLAVNIRGQERGALELWMDIPTKKIVLMSDNFYSTSAGKYASHLK